MNLTLGIKKNKERGQGCIEEGNWSVSYRLVKLTLTHINVKKNNLEL